MRIIKNPPKYKILCDYCDCVFKFGSRFDWGEARVNSGIIRCPCCGHLIYMHTLKEDHEGVWYEC